jgi:glycosyltransferase involved in cell wall biosynthesis
VIDPSRPRSVLFLTHDPVGAEMGGNAIRAFELARAAAARMPVTLAAPAGKGDPPSTPATIARFDPGAPTALKALIDAATDVVAMPQGPLVAGWLRRSGARLVHDLYDAAPFETLEIFSGRHRAIRAWWATLAYDHALAALHDGHQLICANDRQRDLWVGAMVGQRLIGPEAYERDPGFWSVIGEVPFGVPEDPPRAGPGLRARFPDLPADAEIVLWNGGIWNWMDPVTAVRAVARLAARRPQVRLVFMGRGPAPGPGARAYEEAQGAARELGGDLVHFNDGWVPYAERGGWLLEADCAISTHADHLETRFSFRTRLLDCFWAGLPVVCTGGDDLAERIERDDLGATAPPGDVGAVAAGLEQVLDRGRAAYAPALARAAADLAWPRVAQPLIDFLTGPVPPRLGDGRPLADPGRRARGAATRVLRAARLAAARR